MVLQHYPSLKSTLCLAGSQMQLARLSLQLHYLNSFHNAADAGSTATQQVSETQQSDCQAWPVTDTQIVTGHHLQHTCPQLVFTLGRYQELQVTLLVSRVAGSIICSRDAQYVDYGSVQRTVRVQYAVRCLVRCLYAAVKGNCNVLVKVSLEVTY